MYFFDHVAGRSTDWKSGWGSWLLKLCPALFSPQTLQAKVRSLEKQKKIFLEKLEQNPIEQQNKMEKELNDTSRQLRETTQRLVVRHIRNYIVIFKAFY